MITFVNLDLLSVGIVVIATCILGFAVFFNNPKSVTNKIFLLYTIDVSLWGIVNYFAYQFTDLNITLWFIRFVIFFATFQSLLIYELFVVFPNETHNFSKIYSNIVRPVIIFVAFLTLTPFIFSKFTQESITGGSIELEKGTLWILFPIMAAGLVVASFHVLIKKIIEIKNNRQALFIILIGQLITYCLILTFNLTLPIIFNNTTYIPLGSLFLFPFIACMSYVIFRYGMFKLKITETVLLTIVLLMVTFFQVIFSQSTAEILFRVSVFVLVLLVTVLILKVVTREAHLRDEIKKLHELKSEFVSFATHEIGTPLTAVNGYISLLEEEGTHELSNKNKEYLHTAKKATDRLITIITEFLDISKLGKNKSEYMLSKTRIEPLIDTLVNEYKNRIITTGINLVCEKDIIINCELYIDNEKVKHALKNILENSIRYTKFGTICIFLTSVNNYCEIKITDTGERSIIRTGVMGYGLGIYAAKQIIEGNGGQFDVQSNGGSTTFNIQFTTVK